MSNKPAVVSLSLQSETPTDRLSMGVCNAMLQKALVGRRCPPEGLAFVTDAYQYYQPEWKNGKEESKIPEI